MRSRRLTALFASHLRAACALGPLWLAPITAHAERVLTLDEATALAQRGPRAAIARADRDAADARIDEAKAAALPRGKVTAFATVSPEIRCVDTACDVTTPNQFSWNLYPGLFAGASLEVTQPLYTFGKLTAARTAARAGAAAQAALEDTAAADTAVDVARAYWGAKLGRELGWMLDDGIEQLTAAVAKIDAEMAAGSSTLTVADRQRLDVLAAEAKVQRADAAQAEAQALAGLRALTGVADATVDEDELTALPHALPTDDAARGAASHRPEVRAAQQGQAAANALATLEARGHLPDVALVGTAAVAYAAGVDEPTSAFANDPYNQAWAGLAVALRWNLEPWTVAARSKRAQAAARKATAVADGAATVASLDVQTTLAEATAAQARITAATGGEQAARAWVASVLQGEAIGAIEPKDLADSTIAWFQMRARLLTAIFQWNVAVVRLRRAQGEYRAP